MLLKISRVKRWFSPLALITVLGVACTPQEADKQEDEFAANKEAFATAYPSFGPSMAEKLDSLYGQFQLAGDFLLGVVNEEGLAYLYTKTGPALGDWGALTGDSPFYIASHTKSFTGTLLAQLAEEGAVDLDKPMAEYLPGLTFNGDVPVNQITVRQLLNHTHGTYGLAFTWKTAFLGYEGGNAELIQTLNAEHRYDSTHVFRYANTGPILAAMVAEAATGKSWKALMAEHIFAPLGMGSTHANVSAYAPNTIRPALTMAPDQSVFQAGFYKADNTMHAAGGIVTSAHDMAAWLQANLTHSESLLGQAAWQQVHGLSAEQDRSYFTYDRFGYSLGWDLATYQTDTLLTRFGGFAGYSFHASLIPSRKLAIVAFSNDSRATPLPHLMANYAYNLLKGEAREEEAFAEELALFRESHERATARPLPAGSMLVAAGAAPTIAHRFVNAQGWPNIVVSATPTGYQMQWGVLSGPVYNIGEGNDTVYLGTLGALMRSFRVRNDSLLTGSLVYTRDE